MAAKTKIYPRSVTKQWMTLIKSSPDNVLILSPYLTSTVAEAVAAHTTRETVCIYTVFDAHNFVSGASSLLTVKKLVEAGYQVHHLPSLHAKAVITDNGASVGSQNLTRGGTRNREITAFVLERAQAADLRSKIGPWIEAATLITADHVAAMEPRVAELKKAFKKLKKLLDDADQNVEAEVVRRKAQRKQEAIEAAARKKRALYRRIRTVSAPLRDAISEASESSSAVTLKRDFLEYDNSRSGRGWSSGSYSALRANGNLLKWKLDDGKIVNVEKTYRHLLVYEDTGRLGWPAFFKSQISKVGSMLTVPTSMLDGLKAQLKYDLIWDDSELLENNVKLTLKSVDLGLEIDVKGYFSLDAFRINSWEDPKGERWHRELALHEDQDQAYRLLEILEDRDGMIEEFRKTLLRPFRFDQNSNNHGLWNFLDGAETRNFQMTLHMVEDQEIFALRGI